MKGSKNIFNADSFQHIYQRTSNGRLIFYRTEDYLLYYTIFSVYAKQFGIRVAKLCLMINHLHALVWTTNKKILTDFVYVVTSVFVREYNQDIGRKGELFEKHFGRASKEGGKMIRSCSIYIDNNPTEKKLCLQAEEYKWNFLAYHSSSYPFSTKIVLRRSSYHLRNAVTLVRLSLKENRFLNYGLLRQLFNKLTTDEKNQLTDYIIQAYNVIEYGLMDKYFGSMDRYLTAVHSNTGKEFGIEEYWDKYSYLPFDKMITISEELGYGGSLRRFHLLKDKELARIVKTIYQKTRFGEAPIAMFMHLDVKKVSFLLGNRFL